MKKKAVIPLILVGLAVITFALNAHFSWHLFSIFPGAENYDNFTIFSKTYDVSGNQASAYICPSKVTDTSSIYYNRVVVACVAASSGGCRGGGTATLSPGQSYQDSSWSCLVPVTYNVIAYVQKANPTCGNNVVETGEVCDPSGQVQSVGSGSYRYCSSDCSSWTNVNCNDGNPCTTDTFDSKTMSCVHTTINSASVDGCNGVNWCVSGSCVPNPNVQCGASKACTSQSLTCPQPYCNGVQSCSYAQPSVTGTPSCDNGICSTLSLTCGNATCVIVPGQCNACSQDKSCGTCGVQKCVNGILQPCTPIQNQCGSGFTCS